MPPVDVIETGIGIIFPILVGTGPVGVGGMAVGVGVFVLGAGRLLAEACMALVARIIKPTVKAKKTRKAFFVCIEGPHLSRWMGSRLMQKAK